MSVQFTPGPLSAGHTFPDVFDAKGRLIAQARYGHNDPDSRDQAFANASLIAAAPDLYEALDALCSTELGVSISRRDAYENALAALAKARGEA